MRATQESFWALSLCARYSFTGARAQTLWHCISALHCMHERQPFVGVAALEDAVGKHLRETPLVPATPFFREAHAKLVMGKGGSYTVVDVLRHAAE